MNIELNLKFSSIHARKVTNIYVLLIFYHLLSAQAEGIIRP